MDSWFRPWFFSVDLLFVENLNTSTFLFCRNVFDTSGGDVLQGNVNV